MKRVYLYIHGKGGNAKEAEWYKNVVDGDVDAVEYENYLPWIAKEIISEKFLQLEKEYDEINIIANSIGAYFSMLALLNKNVKKAFFISPIVDMEKLILNMMAFENVSEKELENRKEIETNFGETLSWKYLCFARQNHVIWNVRTFVLYGENDNMTSLETIEKFVKEHDASLSIIKNGEHWFHTKEQMDFLSDWLKNCLKND